MYSTPYSTTNNEREVIEFMCQQPFVVITGVDKHHHPVATHVPVIVEERDGKLFLLAHIKKQTDHYKAFMLNPDVLVIFSGAHSYISASWYKDQQQVSTWNYQAVHAKGKLRFLDDDALLDILQRLTRHFENDPASPALVENLPVEYVSHLSKAIVAFEVEVSEVGHVFKLSQNRDEESYRNIINHLNDGDCMAKLLASVMEENRKP
jgi:transcriptional regulator